MQYVSVFNLDGLFRLSTLNNFDQGQPGPRGDPGYPGTPGGKVSDFSDPEIML